MAIQSKEVLNEEGKQYHIQCKKGDVGKYVLVPGDPFRTDAIAQMFDDPVLVAHNRENIKRRESICYKYRNGRTFRSNCDRGTDSLWC